MRIVHHVSSTSGSAKSYDIPKRLLEPIGRVLRTGDPAATVDRLFVSQHVKDLRLIVAFALIAVILVGVIGFPIALENVRGPHLADLTFRQVAFSTAGRFLAFFAPVLGVFGAVLAWAYQTGSARLGIVDLFACEIGTLCRVATLVESVRRSIELFQRGLPQGRNGAGQSKLPTHEFTSQGNYFPVFENNTRDLQALEASVVVNITAFYTYMKAVRDSTRALLNMDTSVTESAPLPSNPSTIDPWHEAARNVIYMMFLGLESGRLAIRDLVEFEPDEAERTIVILISELEAYRFLRDQFPDEADMRHQRLALRDAVYREVVPRVCRDVEEGRASERKRSLGGAQKSSQWEPALRLIPELKRRYDAAMNRSFRRARSASIA